jgi:hypothetical protein
MKAAASVEVGITQLLGRYMACIDQLDWSGVAACFSDDSESLYNGEPNTLHGGYAVADFIRRATAEYAGTVHDLANIWISDETDAVRARSRALIGMTHRISGVITIRAIQYEDEFIELADHRWRIRRRLHQPLWQFDTPGTTPHLSLR